MNNISQEAKNFMLGLEHCREAKGMYWHGKIPQDIVELFGLKISEVSPNYTIAGVHVTTKPQYESFTPEWLKKG